MKRVCLVLLLSVWLVGCATTPGERWTRTEMYFGLLRLDRTPVSEAEWETFIEQVVTPRFPAGLTILNGAGQWRTAAGRIDREPSKVLIILHPRNETIDAKIEEVRRLYCERFNQEAVMKVTSDARVAF